MRYLVAALLTSFLSLCMPAQAAQPGSPQLFPAFPVEALQPSRQNDQYQQGLRGLWSLPGGGYFVDVRADGPRFYTYADGGKLCWLDQALTSLDPDESPLAYYAQSPEKTDTVFTDVPGDVQFHARTIAALPAACGDAIDRSTPLDTFDAAVASLHDYYSFSAARHVDWAERGNNLRPVAAAARNDVELAGVFSELLEGLQDVHTSIAKDNLKIEMDLSTSTVRTHRLLREAFAQQSEIVDFSTWFEVWNQTQNDAIYALLSPQGRGRVYGDAFMWGTLAGNVGYLAINRVDKLDSGGGVDDRTAVAQTLDRALGEMQGTRALVLDISMNTGGSTDIIAAAAARFADRRRLVYTREMPKDPTAAPQPFYIEPAGTVRYAQPVYVLTSDVTVSAAEYLILYMRVLPQATQIGQTTQGALAGSFVRGLPNGWHMAITNHITRDARGNSYEVVGIHPDVIFDVFPESGFDAGHVNAIRKGVELAGGSALTVAAPAIGNIAPAIMVLLLIAVARVGRSALSARSES